MGRYLNPGCRKFQRAMQSEIYVDKTELISYTNSVFDTEKQYLCVSRPRRFGKSMAANMLSAYYDRTVDAATLFRGLKIANDKNFHIYRNRYDVIAVNMQEFLSRSHDTEAMLKDINSKIVGELRREYPAYLKEGESDLVLTMSDVFMSTTRPFVVIIDEWDCVFRERTADDTKTRKYLDFLRYWLKDQDFLGLVYMTGILPIKKYGTHSALNMFREFSMTNAGPLAPFFGFTEEEVYVLCARYKMDFEECRTWYDGYLMEEKTSIYSPQSVVESMEFRKFGTYWNQTETFEALKVYIDLDYDGLREAIISLMAKEPKQIDIGSFTNDMTTFRSMDDVLTLLIHLGYLAYDVSNSNVCIPNQEVMMEYVNAVKGGGWSEVTDALRQSQRLLEATYSHDEETVSTILEAVHLETSHLQYNDENALSYTVSLAYYYARRHYVIFRELPTGKGFADMVFLPRHSHSSLPALIIELKWDKNVNAAIRQIKDRQYVKSLEGYVGKVLLVGINYSRDSRKHECRIEEWNIGD